MGEISAIVDCTNACKMSVKVKTERLKQWTRQQNIRHVLIEDEIFHVAKVEGAFRQLECS